MRPSDQGYGRLSTLWLGPLARPPHSSSSSISQSETERSWSGRGVTAAYTVFGTVKDVPDEMSGHAALVTGPLSFKGVCRHNSYRLYLDCAIDSTTGLAATSRYHVEQILIRLISERRRLCVAAETVICVAPNKGGQVS